jgi:hypothetical protein
VRIKVALKQVRVTVVVLKKQELLGLHILSVCL